VDREALKHAKPGKPGKRALNLLENLYTSRARARIRMFWEIFHLNLYLFFYAKLSGGSSGSPGFTLRRNITRPIHAALPLTNRLGDTPCGFTNKVIDKR
jgi:hypothetical protein